MLGRVLDRTRTAAALTLALGGCLEVPAPPPKDAVALRDLKAPEGVGLEVACTPTGVERCFDARDDNCNGLIDEGCGLQTGILQFTIAWPDKQADVDLNVTDPAGQLAATGETTSSGLLKDRDCPRPECQGQNVENVYLVDGPPRRGRYRVVVRLDKLSGATAPVVVRLGARVGQRSFGATVELSPGAATESRTFELEL
jgi:tRNA (guanosine-2'-O-)-methyltransferase